MPQIVNMLDAKTSLSKLVQEIESGGAKEFIIARNGHPAARLVPLAAPREDRSCRIGIAKDRFKVPDDFDKANDAVLRLFESV